MRNFDLNVSKRRTFVFSDVCMTLRNFVNCTRRIDPKTFVLFGKIGKPAALCHEIRNPMIVHLSIQPLHFCHRPFSVFGWVDLQPACAQTITFHRICIPVLFYKIDIREDANYHKVI